MDEALAQDISPPHEEEQARSAGIVDPEMLEGAAEFDRNFEVITFAEGKMPSRNEDVVAVGDKYLVIADGATDKTGLQFEKDPETGLYKTGGEIAASIAAAIAGASEKTGLALVQEVTDGIRSYYAEHNPEALTDSAYRFATTIVAARIVGDRFVVTQVGDSLFRINGTTVYENNKAVDKLRASERIRKIQELAELRPNGIPTELDIAAGREAIQDELNKQHLLQNNVDDPLGYGVLDGTAVPDRFVKIYDFPLDSITTFELVSDGYYGAFPDEATVPAWEAVHRRQLETDPYNIDEFPSNKSSRNGQAGYDRSVIISHKIER
jgi:hypothetical protein